MGDYLQQLYQGLKAKNPQMPDYDHFKADMNDEENRTKLYEVLKLKNPKLPDFRTFSQDMGFISSKPRGVLDGGDLVDLDQVQPQSSGFWNDYVAEPLKRIGVDAGKLENDSAARNHEVEKEGGFWGSYAGDLIEKIGAGASNFGGTMYSAFDKLTSQDDLYRKQREVSLNDSPALKKYFDEHGVPENERSVFVGNNFLKGEADNAYQYADILRNRAERNSGKGFAELWKEGDYRGAVGDVFLQATESLPQSLMAMFGGGAGLALTGVSSGVNKYDQLDKTPDGKDMPEFSKVVNAVSTGTFEALSEKLGDVPIGRWLTDVYKNVGADVAKKSIKEGVSGWMQGMYKRYGVLIAPISEGVEEVASQVAENITDYCTGVTDEWKPLDGTLESFVYGAGGGAQFSVAGMPGVVKQWHNGRVVKKQQREQFSQFANKDGRIVTARDLDDNPYYVLNEGGGMSIVMNDQGEKTAIATKDLKVESDEALDEHIARFNKEYVGKGMVTSDVAALNPGQDVTYSGESGRVQRVESDGTVVVEFGDPENGGHVERVSLSELSPAENTGTDNKNSQEVVQGTGQPDQQNTEQPNEGTAGQMEQKGQPSIPTQKDGTPDYNVLLEENPGVFAELWEKRSTPEKAKQALERQSNAITKKIESLQKKLENETDWNKVARIEDESAGLEARKAKVDEVISSRYAEVEVETGKDVANTATPSIQERLEVPAENSKQGKEENKSVEESLPEGVDGIRPVGRGVFGNIYDQFRGKAKEAIDFLLNRKEGEAVGALHHPQVGDIDLVWGNEKAGLMKIVYKHPDVLQDLQGLLDEMKVVRASDNRIILESDTHKAIVSKKLGDVITDDWLLTAYEKKKGDISASSSDIETEPEGKQNGTAPLQNITLSESKDSEIGEEKQEAFLESTQWAQKIDKIINYIEDKYGVSISLESYFKGSQNIKSTLNYAHKIEQEYLGDRSLSNAVNKHFEALSKENQGIKEGVVGKVKNNVSEKTSLTESKSEIILSETEYVEKEIRDYYISRNGGVDGFDEWRASDDSLDAENSFLNSYSDYVKSLLDSGEMQKAFDNSGISAEIKIRKAVEVAGFDINDVLDTKSKRGKDIIEENYRVSDGDKSFISFKFSDGSVHYGEVTGTDKSRVIVKDSTGRTYRVQPESIISRYGSKEEMLDAEAASIESANYESKDGIVRFSVWKNSQRMLSLSKEGEYCSVERVFSESKAFSFTSGEKIESLADVAYIFKNLENSSIENSFAVMVKDGSPTVIHLGMGDFNSSGLNLSAIKAAYDSMIPDRVFFVHNHPSGELKASFQDVNMCSVLAKMLPPGVFQEGIIINLKSGNFGVFNSKGENELKKTKSVDKEISLKLYSFDKQVFASDFNPNGLSRIRNDEDVASFISSHRLGDRKKISFLILNQGNGVIGNIHTEFISIDDVDAVSEKIATNCIRFGGAGAILYGDFNLQDMSSIVKMVKQKSGGSITLLDGVAVKGNNSNYLSAQGEGVMENAVEYRQNVRTGETDDVRFRAVESSEEQYIVDMAKEDGTYLKAPNGKDTSLSPKQWVQVRTKAFKEWFGDWEHDPSNASKVVDENGEPKVVYHNTNEKRTIFDTNFVRKAQEIEAHFFAPHSDKYGEYGKVENQCFLNLRNPSDFKTAYEGFSDKLAVSSIAGTEQREQLQSIGYDGGILSEDGFPYEYFVFSSSQIKSATDNVGTFSKDNADIRFREKGGIEEVNSLFNEELSILTEENADSKVFHLGMPSEALLSSGIPNKPFRLYGNKLLKKVKKHGFKPSDIRNLPIALENPIAVFVGSHKSSYAILTELEIGENKVLVSVETNKDGEIDFNLVSSVFGKSSRGVVDWVNSNKMRFSNKEKTLDYLSTSALSADATNNSEFDSATNIVKNFENPTLEEGEISSAIDNLSDELGVKVNRVKGRDELPEGIRRWMKSDRYPGMFDPKSGNVYVVMDEVLDAADAQATLLHEIVGHKGIHGLFGDRLPEFCERVLASMDEKKRTELVDRFRDEEEKRTEEAIRQLAAEEYVASFAEGYHDPGAWEKVKAIVKEFMRELGIDLKLSDNDLKYILWKAKNGLKDGDTAMDAISKIAKDKRVGDVLFRNADVQKAEKFADKKMSMAENVRIALQDSALAVKQLQDEIRRRGGKVADFADVYVEGMLATSRSKVAIENFDKEVFNPLIDVVSDIQKRGKSLEDIELYMMAKHASERNKVLFEKEGVENGSGLSDADANEIVKKFESDIPGALIDTLWNRVKSATGFTTKRWFEDGLIDKDTKELYDRQYKYYVPLRGWKESGDIDYVTSERRSGGVVNVNKQAHGRSSVADSPLAFIANMAHSAIVIGDKNRVKQNLFNLVVNNPQKDLYTVNRIYYVETEVDGKKTWLEQIEKPSQKLFDEGKVMTSINDEYKIARTTGQAKQHEVSLYRNGERYIIAFNGQKGVDVANAINGINRPDFSLFQNSIGAVTRWLSAAYTSKNPAFIPVNFLRDLGYAVPAYMIKGGNGINLSTNLTKAFGAIHADLSGKIKKDTELNRFYDEFKSNGGLTGFVHMTDVDTYKKNIERDLRKMAGRKSFSDIVFHNFALKKAGDMMEYMSQMSENSLRFAVYMTERQAGKSAKESAIAAKEITVNFNRKGTWSPFFGSFYAFFNASMQGGYNVANLAKHHPGKFAVAAAGFMAIQYFASQFARAFGGDDELGENYYDQLSDYIKYDHLVLPNVLNIGDGKFITIPLGHGFRAIGSIGVIAGEIITGNKSADKGVWELVNNLFDSFSPMQLNSFHLDEGDVINTLAGFTPTAMQPIVDVALNRDFTGRQVYKEPFMSKQKGRVAESNLGQKNTNPLLVDFTKWLNKTAGGDVYSATDLQMDDDGSLKRVPFFKWLDRNPAAIEHLIEGYAGGRGKFWNNLFKTVESAVTGKEIETNNIPVLRRLYQSPWEKSHWRIYFELRDEVGDFDFMSGAMKNARDFTSYRKLLQNSDQMRKVMMYKAYEKPIMKMNELIGAMDDDEMVEQLRLRREALVMELAKRVKQVKDK